MPNRYERQCGYEFRRLSPEAKLKLLDSWRATQVEYEWWNYVYDDAKNMGALMGIEIENIQFSGFWCQGDGASFTGRYAHREGTVQEIVQACGGQDKELIRIASELAVLQTTFTLQHGHSFECHITRSAGNYVHEGTMYVGDWGKEDLTGDWDKAHDLAMKFQTLLRKFADWIYSSLEAEHEHLTSDETVIESLMDSGLRFDSSGDTI